MTIHTDPTIIDLSRPRPEPAWHADLRRLGFEPADDDSANTDAPDWLHTWRMIEHPGVICNIMDLHNVGMGTRITFCMPWGNAGLLDADKLHAVTAVLVDGARNELEPPKPNVIDLRPVVDDPVCARLCALGFQPDDPVHWTLTDKRGKVRVTLDPEFGVATITDFETKAETELPLDQLAHVDRIEHGWN